MPFYDKIQQDWNIFNNQYGRQIFETLLKERDSTLSLNTKVDYSKEVKNAANDWDRMKKLLLYQYRYLAIEELNESNYYKEAFNIHNNIVKANVVLYRSRVNEKDISTPFSKLDMGAPPHKLATAGRANPQGIPYLYLCDDTVTTLYEVRALYLDYISTGKFISNQDLHIVDFTKTDSPFNTIYSDVKSGIISEFILKHISQDLSRPMRRGDTAFEYIPTQFICEYIRHQMKADGIAFKSSLYEKGINYVIFNPDAFECQDDVQVHIIKKVTIEGQIIA